MASIISQVLRSGYWDPRARRVAAVTAAGTALERLFSAVADIMREQQRRRQREKEIGLLERKLEESEIDRAIKEIGWEISARIRKDPQADPEKVAQQAASSYVKKHKLKVNAAGLGVQALGAAVQLDPKVDALMWDPALAEAELLAADLAQDPERRSKVIQQWTRYFTLRWAPELRKAMVSPSDEQIARYARVWNNVRSSVPPSLVPTLQRLSLQQFASYLTQEGGSLRDLSDPDILYTEIGKFFTKHPQYAAGLLWFVRPGEQGRTIQIENVENLKRIAAEANLDPLAAAVQKAAEAELKRLQQLQKEAAGELPSIFQPPQQAIPIGPTGSTGVTPQQVSELQKEAARAAIDTLHDLGASWKTKTGGQVPVPRGGKPLGPPGPGPFKPEELEPYKSLYSAVAREQGYPFLKPTTRIEPVGPPAPTIPGLKVTAKQPTWVEGVTKAAKKEVPAGVVIGKQAEKIKRLDELMRWMESQQPEYPLLQIEQYPVIELPTW